MPIFIENQIPYCRSQEIGRRREQGQFELEALERQKTDILRRSGLETLQRTVKEFVESFESLTRVEQRNFIERIVGKATVREGNILELSVYEEPSVIRRNQSTDSKRNGVADGI